MLQFANDRQVYEPKNMDTFVFENVRLLSDSWSSADVVRSIAVQLERKTYHGCIKQKIRDGTLVALTCMICMVCMCCL